MSGATDDLRTRRERIRELVGEALAVEAHGVVRRVMRAHQLAHTLDAWLAEHADDAALDDLVDRIERGFPWVRE